MDQLRAIASRFLDGIDVLFDGLAALWRILIRGAFQSDRRSFRSQLIVPLPASDVYLQTVSLSAEDAREARRAITLEPEAYLPLDAALLSFDVAGPLPFAAGEEAANAGPRFLLGAVRRDRLQELRSETTSGDRSAEAFKLEPVDHPTKVLVFQDENGRARRRRRRLLTASATALVAVTGYDAATAWLGQAEVRVEAAEREIAQAQRRVRLAERRLARARTAFEELQTSSTRPLSEPVAHIASIARRLPADAEVTELDWSPMSIRLQGRSYTPQAVELELRRLFENSTLSFSSTGENPAAFTAEIALTAPDARPHSGSGHTRHQRSTQAPTSP